VISLPVSTPEILYRVGGTVVGVALAVVTAVWEAMLTTLYVTHGSTVIRLPVAPILAIITNIAIVIFVARVTELPILAVLTGVVWSALIFISGSLTAEGDLLILGNWVGILTTFLGSFAWVGAVYVIIVRRNVRNQPPPPVVPAVATRPPRPGSRPAKRPTKR
jgi:hypothetical protein